MQHSDESQQQTEGHAARTPITALGSATAANLGVGQPRMAGRGVPAVTATTALGGVSTQQAVTVTSQTVMVSAQAVPRLLSPTSLPANSVHLSGGLTVLQQRLASPGVAVSAQDLQQVLQQVSQQPITLLTTTDPVTDPSQRPHLARPVSFPLSSKSVAPTTVTAITTTSVVSATGATIHHHGQSPVRGAAVTTTALPHSNLQHNSHGMNLSSQQQQQRRIVAASVTATCGASASPIPGLPAMQSRTVAEVRAPTGQPPSLKTASAATGPPPKKKQRLEEKPPATADIGSYRRLLLELKHAQMKELKTQYFDNLTELFYLQSGMNFIDFAGWKKRPTPQLVHFLKQSKMDSDEEEEVLTVTEINSEVKVLTNPGSNVPVATPVAISTTLPPMVSALSQQVVAPSAQNTSAGSSTSTSASTTLSAGTAALNQQLPGKSPEAKTPVVKSQQSPFKQKTPSSSPNQKLGARQQTLSQVYDNISGSSQEVIVERAKQEAHVIQRVAELRKDGLWSSKRLPRVQEPARQKAHWDYLLEEMTWLAADFVQERKWKKAAARKVARMVSNYFREQEQKGVKAEKEEAIKVKKIAGHMAKMVKEFWTNIEKVVQYKQQTRLEEKKKRALDLHLSFIVDQTEKYSTWLTEGLQGGSASGSVGSSPEHSSDGGDFEPDSPASDDEETIEKEEEEAEKECEDADELAELQKTGDMPLEDLLKTLPQEVLEAPALLPSNCSAGSDGDEEEEDDESDAGEKDGSDKEFMGVEEDAEDREDTIAEQEKHEKRDYKNELKDLQDEGEMSIEDLAAKYAGAYDSDFEIPQESSEEEEDDEDEESESDDFEIETEPSSDEENMEEKKTADLGLASLVKCKQDSSFSSLTPSSSATSLAKTAEKDQREDEINDIAAEALRLQPKGYTLETTEVKTKVPFLLKHSLREYQHVGLDWLATMHEKRLNGILADEMGLGKTIQTIALLAHLACDKGIWGPHLIVVPTSVMLNWEMEIKKWCPAFKILTYYGNQKERKLKRTGWTKTNAFHVCITSYKLVVQDHQAFRRKKWKYLILDEAQNIKNFKSQRWQMLLNFSSQRRLLLTGTPLQNSLMELWSLMHFLMPNVFQSHRDFKEWFANPLTGMIEGSQEYNESLVKRLHKVLRPFLLRRLKNEVEKQMPKKFEHVVMCKLSKRQRFLYDDFMSQAKTKETLESGHYMSVINILMQLRKVCNHPNLFDPRPVVSPFCMEGLVHLAPSLVARALDSGPLEEIDMKTMFPNLAEMEQDLPAFVAHRVKQLKTPQRLIQEIDMQPDPPQRPPPGQLKPLVFRSISPALQGRVGSPVEMVKGAVGRSATPPPSSLATSIPGVVKLVSQGTLQSILTSSLQTTSAASVSHTFSQVRTASGQTLLLASQPRAGGPALVFSSGSTLVASSSSGTTNVTPVTATGLQAKVLPQQINPGVAQPITLQIQQTEHGTRLMLPGNLGQLPASLLQIVQTSSGQQFLTATAPVSQASGAGLVTTAASSPLCTALVSTPVTMTASSTVSSTSAPVTVGATASASLITTTIGQLKTVPAAPATTPTPFATTAGIVTTVAPVSSANKPVMRVSPMVVTTAMTTLSIVTTTSCLPASVVSSVVSTLKSVMSPKAVPSPPVKHSEFFLEVVHKRRQQRRQEKLKRLARINSQHCSRTPVYGPDLVQTLSLLADIGSNYGNQWLYTGHANCQAVHTPHNSSLPKYSSHETSLLADLVKTPEMYLAELRDTLDRFAFAIPPVISHSVQMRLAHPDPSSVVRFRHMSEKLQNELRPLSMQLNSVRMKMSINFPELRLIQYDCGKLQTLDVLLRQLKTGSHRVLIFTQMTKMLDVLEAFLNYHGHRYLRLDGTTRVEQRQALMDRFNADKRIFCFILSTRSGGIGVNLTGADTVIFYDSDWNPTMDAQAQDRCHRIGQTRDVHIYRLISEMTVEENILKKANQKRLLGDLAIEGGNFTTAFFKQQTIQDLFAQPSGLQSLMEEKNGESEDVVVRGKEEQEEEADEEEEEEVATIPECTPSTCNTSVVAKKGQGKDKDVNLMAAFEQALCKAEDESDALAATLVKAEQKAELAEFDENIPWDEREAEARKEEDEMSRAEMELAMLDKELTPIERYAVSMMEIQMEDEVAEELKMAEEDILNSKKEWELARLKALKEEEERRAELEEDEMLYTYLRDDAQVFVGSLDGSEMPIWAPPTPPQDDNDVYLDPTLFFLYEGNVMSESQLPPVFARKEHKKPRLEHITTRKQKQRKEEAPRIPRSLFDRPSSAIMKQRREQKMQKLVRQSALFKHMGIPMRPPHPPPKTLEQSEGHPEWLIHEDWALLSAVQDLCRLPLNLHVQQNAHQVNWDLVADVVNSVSRTYRSIKQCRARYENTIIPREEGKLLYDVSPRKQKKQKTSYKTKNNRPMKTSQLMTQDNNNSVTLLYSLRFDSIKAIAVKRPPPSRPTLNNPSMKNPKHLAVLQEYNINFDQPLNPVQVAANRAERIAREKKNAQQTAATEAAQRPAAQTAGATLQTVVGAASQAVVQAVTASAAQAISATSLHSLVAVSGTPTTIITGTASRAAIAQGMTAVTIARTLSAPGNIVAVTGGRGIGQRVAVHDIGTVAGTVTAAQVAAGQLQARTVLQPSVSASLTQKVAAIAGTSAALTATSVHPSLAAVKSLAHQQFNLLRPILRSQAPGTATQAQQLRTQKQLSFTNKGMVRAMSHQLSEEQLKALKLQAAQLLQGPLQVGQSGSTSQAPVTLVKSVSAAAGTTGIPIPVTINVTMGGQQKAGMPASRGATVSQLQQQQQQRMLLQHRKGVPIQQSQRVTALSNIRGGQIPLIIPQKAQLTGQLLHQIVKQQQMNSQPAIISVTQGQSLTPMVAKVSLTTGPHTGSIQTLSTVTGTPITVTQVVAAVSTPQAGGVSVTQHTPTVATINMASGSSQATVVKTATIVDPATASKMANITHSLVSQPLQVVSSALAQQQGQTVVAATGTQHRVLTAATASIPQGATVVMSSTSPSVLSAPATSAPAAIVQQAVIAASPSVLSVVPPSSTIATVVTQTQSQQPQQQTAGVAAATQQNAQKPPYTMRTRNQPKH